MTIRLRDSTNQEPDFFVWDLPDFTTKICSNFPIGSKELQTLLRVSQHLREIVYYIYTKNMQDILKRYANYDTPLNRIVFIIKIQPNLSLISFETIYKIQQSIIQQINALGVPCPNKQLVLEDIPRFNQAIEDLNLQKIWVPISRLLPVEGKPAENAPAQEIRLWMNQNQNLLQNIVLLDLSGRALTTIPREISLLTGLQKLGLHNNQITVLPQGIFAGLNQLQILDLENNQITVLPQGIFAGLNQLQWLGLHNNQISVLPQGIFAGLIRLRGLGINNNQITVLPQDIFAGLIRLQGLGLDNNRITVLPQGIFTGLNQLQVLALRNNRITFLPQGIFDGLHQLQGLYLYGNPGLLFSYQDMQTPVSNNLKAYKEFNAYFCKSPFAKFYQFVAQGNSFYDGKVFPLPLYLHAVILAKADEEPDYSLSYEELVAIVLKKAIRWIFEMSADELKNVTYAHVLQLAQKSDALKREQNPGLPPEDFTNPNWGRDHARDNILRLIDAMSLTGWF